MNVPTREELYSDVSKFLINKLTATITNAVPLVTMMLEQREDTEGSTGSVLSDAIRDLHVSIIAERLVQHEAPEDFDEEADLYAASLASQLKIFAKYILENPDLRGGGMIHMPVPEELTNDKH